jgi:hypothetical protein
MATPLKVTHLDSPLRRSDEEIGSGPLPVSGDFEGESTEEKSPELDSPPAARAEGGSSSPGVVARPAATPTPRRRSRPRRRAATEAPAATSPSKDAWPPAQGFWEPPALDERVELTSTRLPVSLSRALDRHTRALRDRHDLASQKALPMQEVLAAVVWALGDPEDKTVVDRLDGIYRSYRARRMAAAARALEQR